MKKKRNETKKQNNHHQKETIAKTFRFAIVCKSNLKLNMSTFNLSSE